MQSLLPLLLLRQLKQAQNLTFRSLEGEYRPVGPDR